MWLITGIDAVTQQQAQPVGRNDGQEGAEPAMWWPSLRLEVVMDNIGEIRCTVEVMTR